MRECIDTFVAHQDLPWGAVYIGDIVLNSLFLIQNQTLPHKATVLPLRSYIHDD